jgi:hypothetical protein
MSAIHPYKIGEWVEPSNNLRKNVNLRNPKYRIEDIGFDYTFSPALPCVKLAGIWVYSADCTKTAPPPPTLAEKEAASNAEDGWRKRRDRILREVFSDRR